MRTRYTCLDTSAHCLVRTISGGAWSTLPIVERISSQARTDSHARALMCSAGPKS